MIYRSSLSMKCKAFKKNRLIVIVDLQSGAVKKRHGVNRDYQQDRTLDQLSRMYQICVLELRTSNHGSTMASCRGREMNIEILPLCWAYKMEIPPQN